MLLWIAFILCTAAIVYAGSRLSRYGDIIAEKTGMGRTWIGVVLMASVTSLPELVTGVSSVTYAGLTDIAVGDVLGSCVFNLLILAVLDGAYRPMPISAKARQGNILSAGFGILMLGFVSISMIIPGTTFSVGWVGAYSIILAIVYFVAMRMIYFYEKKQLAEFFRESVEKHEYEDVSMATALKGYGINAAIVVVAAMFLPGIGEGIAEATGLGQSFVGNIFIAISTSLPEVVVSVAAVRIGSIDLAIGNLFGSNIFNVFILGIDDFFYQPGPILAFVGRTHIIPALCAIMMTAVSIIGLMYRAEKKYLIISWDSVVIVLLYFINLMLLYGLR